MILPAYYSQLLAAWKVAARRLHMEHVRKPSPEVIRRRSINAARADLDDGRKILAIVGKIKTPTAKQEEMRQRWAAALRKEIRAHTRQFDGLRAPAAEFRRFVRLAEDKLREEAALVRSWRQKHGERGAFLASCYHDWDEPLRTTTFQRLLAEGQP